MGLTNVTNVTLENLTSLSGNVSSPVEFIVNVNTMVYQGLLYFILLWVLWFILMRVSTTRRDQILNNMMYSSAVCSILSLILRAICFGGNCLLTDHYVWVFPLMTLGLVLFIYTSRER